jgi:hypothetical protein
MDAVLIHLHSIGITSSTCFSWNMNLTLLDTYAFHSQIVCISQQVV